MTEKPQFQHTGTERIAPSLYVYRYTDAQEHSVYLKSLNLSEALLIRQIHGMYYPLSFNFDLNTPDKTFRLYSQQRKRFLKLSTEEQQVLTDIALTPEFDQRTSPYTILFEQDKREAEFNKAKNRRESIFR